MKAAISDLRIVNRSLDRRSFIKGMGAAGALLVSASWSWVRAAEPVQTYGGDAMPGGTSDDPKVFVRIDPDGSVTIVCARSEMGQGIRTSLALVVADELEAVWDRCRVEQAEGDQDRYGNQDTDGSRSMRHWFQPMRRCGAAARTLLELAAAQRWGVPVDEVRAAQHRVAHIPTGRELRYGELAGTAQGIAVPETARLRLKSPDQFRLIGRENRLSADGAAIVSGRAVYGADMRFENMLHAVVARPPVLGSRLGKVDETAARRIPGVVDVVRIEPRDFPVEFHPLGGVAVIATNTWAAIKGREALQLEWTASPHDHYDSTSYRTDLEAAALRPGKVVREAGDVTAAAKAAARSLSATYYLPHLAHASMEPPAALARWHDGLLEIWAPTQAPQAAREKVAQRLGVPIEKTRIHVTLLGGGFGRKSKPDFIIEAAELARGFPGRAVQVLWTREDDLRHDYFHTVSVEHLEASMDAGGKVTGWLHRTVAPTIVSTFARGADQQAAFELGMGVVNLPFAVPNLRMENPAAAAHTRIGWFRSVSNIPHAFAVQSFVHELATAQGKDHREFYLELLGADRAIDPGDLKDGWNHGEDPRRYPVDTARLRAVLRRATDAAGWGRALPRGRGLGFAVHYSFVSYVCAVLEVEVAAGGELTVHQAHLAVDCGPAINPDRVRAQMEGACIMGLGLATTGEIRFAQGRPQAGNFHEYEVPRISLAPRSIAVHLVDGPAGAELGGVGEPGVPPIAPALTNAIFAATGRRIRALPLRDQLA